jgi:thioester reductase-like protein
MRRPDGTVLLTGATGFVGMELLARYLERSER